MKQKTVGYLLKQITDRIKISADTALKEQTLTLSQARVLKYISDYGGAVTQKSIEDYLQVSHPTVVGIVSRMERSGFLDSYFDEGDRRMKMVCLTEKAQCISQKMQTRMDMQEQQLLKGLSQESIDSLYHLLEIMLKNVT